VAALVWRSHCQLVVNSGRFGIGAHLAADLRMLAGLRPRDARTMWTRLKLLGDWIPVSLMITY
jgi:hypothetical protein